MTPLGEDEQRRLRRAEESWLRQSAERLRRAADARRAERPERTRPTRPEQAR
ncbi:hypothetical protein [Nocardioides dongkuii]|uniref:hypothetical protein n=1 Tax=Nocardioides dongkuii TaxID=2760089 RepID=UPI0015F9E6F3|nr:hypothetical protein [Nocardioides dongkuii]